MTAQNTVIALRDVRFSYDSGATWVLDGVDLTIRRGERICLVGPNGSGKSTLSRVIAGLVAPDSGYVDLLGNVVFDDSGAHASAYRAARRGIGAVFQRPEDQIVTTVTEDDIAFGPENLAVDHDGIGRRIAASLEAVDMADSRRSDPTRMSGGQQQRVAIAGMLAMDSTVLVLDEPTAMLDPQGRAEVMRVLDALQAKGTTIVMVTHHRDELAHADRVVRLEHGRAADVSDDRGVACAGDAMHAAGVAGVGGGRVLHMDARADAEGVRVRDVAADHAKTRSIADDPIIEVRDVAYRYPDTETAVFRHLDLTVRTGEVVALMGRNGAGKSTLARMLCALARPQSGGIVVDGIAVARMRDDGPSRMLSRKERERLRRVVGYVMQHPERQLFAETVAEDIAYGPRNQGLDAEEVSRRVDRAMRLLHIGHLADRSPFDLSGGQQRLVAIAGVVACHPKVLVMDEPTAGLDELAVSRVHGLIRALKERGVTVLVISHSREEAQSLADRIVTMESLEGRDADGSSAAADGAGQGGSARVRSAHDGDMGRDENRDGAREGAGSAPSASRGWVQRLDPRVKMLATLVLMFSAFAIGSFWQLLLAAALAVAIGCASRIGVRRLFRSVHMFLLLFVLCGLLNVFFVRSGNVLVNLGPVPITDDGVRIAVLYACRFAVVIVIGAMFLASTTPTAMTDAFESVLKPCSRFGVHTQEIALVMSLALRFLPTLGDEARAIADAQSARGGSIETGSFIRRIRAMAAIVVPVFAGTIRHADNLSLALDARCYEEGVDRTHWRVMRIRGRDIVACAVIMAYLAALAALPYIGR